MIYGKTIGGWIDTGGMLAGFGLAIACAVTGQDSFGLAAIALALFCRR